MSTELEARLRALAEAGAALEQLGALADRFPVQLAAPLDDALTLRVRGRAIAEAVVGPQGLLARHRALQLPRLTRREEAARRKEQRALVHEVRDLSWQLDHLAPLRGALADAIAQGWRELAHRGQAAAEGLGQGPVADHVPEAGSDPAALRASLQALRRAAARVARLEALEAEAARLDGRVRGLAHRLDEAARGNPAAEALQGRWARWRREALAQGATGLDRAEAALQFLRERVDLWEALEGRLLAALEARERLALRDPAAPLPSGEALLDRAERGAPPAGEALAEAAPSALQPLLTDRDPAELVHEAPLWDAWLDVAARWSDAPEAGRAALLEAMGSLLAARRTLRQPQLLEPQLEAWALEAARGTWSKDACQRVARRAKALAELEPLLLDLEVPRALGLLRMEDADPASLAFQMRLAAAVRGRGSAEEALAGKLSPALERAAARPVVRAVLGALGPAPPAPLAPRPHELVPVALGELDREGAAGLAELAARIAPRRATELRELLEEELARSRHHTLDPRTGIAVRVPARMTVEERWRLRGQLERVAPRGELDRLLADVEALARGRLAA